MIRAITLIATLLATTACSAQAPANKQAGGSTTQAGNVAGPGPEGPQPAGADQPVPKDAPSDPSIRNVAATTGRANRPATPPPFGQETLGKFDTPFAVAVLPDGSALVTEKGGTLKMRSATGRIADIRGVPAVAEGGQGGLLDVAIAPDFAQSKTVYLSYSEPRSKGSALALMRATLTGTMLEGGHVIWRAGSDGPGGQYGANIAFAPDGKSLFLSSGERQRFSPAQDPEQALGKILRLTPDGKAWPGNPDYKAGGVRAQTWSSGHRNPYGLAFTADGRLWEVEMGPQGGDELNLIEPGKNYGWPTVSNGDNYSGKPIPDHPSRPDFAAPTLWWNPSISPGGMIAYTGATFPQYRGSLFISALSGTGVIRVAVNGASATPADYWDFGTRIRDLAQGPDGSIWVLQDDGPLVRLTPKK